MTFQIAADTVCSIFERLLTLKIAASTTFLGKKLLQKNMNKISIVFIPPTYHREGELGSTRKVFAFQKTSFLVFCLKNITKTADKMGALRFLKAFEREKKINKDRAHGGSPSHRSPRTCLFLSQSSNIFIALA